MSRRRSRPAARPPAPLPDEFRQRMAALLGGDVHPFLAALESPVAGLRVNTLRLSAERFRDIAPFPVEPLPFPPEGFRVAEGVRPGTHPYHAAGLYYLQDPGAMVVGALPEIRPGMRVLDLAAAPGGKATHLAARMAGTGVLVANDVHPGRAWELAGNLERFGVRNAIVTADEPARLAERWPATFDLVLVDAPCSGESMFHKSEAARREWSPASVRGCARRQQELLQSAVRMVRSGGTLLYSTCTFAPEENEQVLAALLRDHPELEMLPLPAVQGSDPARPAWADAEERPDIALGMRLWPHRFPGAGHFVAALRRPDTASLRAGGEGYDAVPPVGADLALLRRFIAEEIAAGDLVGESGMLTAGGEELFAAPRGAPSLAGIRVLRPGLWLGSVRPGRFEPSHSLAMAMAPGEAARTRDWPEGSREVQAFLRGEALRDDGEPGWVLVTVDGFALGWGKRSGGVLKNHYPRGLRTR